MRLRCRHLLPFGFLGRYIPADSPCGVEVYGESSARCITVFEAFFVVRVVTWTFRFALRTTNSALLIYHRHNLSLADFNGCWPYFWHGSGVTAG